MNHIIHADIAKEYVGYTVTDEWGTPYTHEVLLGDTCEYHLPGGRVMDLVVVTTSKDNCRDCSLDADNLCPRRKDGKCVLYAGDDGPRLAFKCIDSILEGL